MFDNKKVYPALVFVVMLASGCGGSGGSTPSPSTLSVSDKVVFEPNTGTDTLTLSVTLSAASTQTVTVNYATVAGTATAGSDYTQTNGMLTFLAGQTQKQITIEILSDTPYDEEDEAFKVVLSNPVGAMLARAEATATIVDIVRRQDTGVTTCADATSNTLACPQTGFDQQDAESGRDATHNDNSDGRAGFSFTKIDGNGSALAANASSWSCVRDEVTKLIWEIKTDDGGLRDRDNTFAWYNPNSATNGGNAGAQSGGICTGGISCNTAAYVAAVNAAGLCGANNWRMPTAEELLSLHDYGATTPPGIDTTYFNDLSIATSLTFWASDTNVSGPTSAWIVDYAIGSGGNSSVAGKSSFPTLVRLVRKP